MRALKEEVAGELRLLEVGSGVCREELLVLLHDGDAAGQRPGLRGGEARRGRGAGEGEVVPKPVVRAGLLLGFDQRRGHRRPGRRVVGAADRLVEGPRLVREVAVGVVDPLPDVHELGEARGGGLVRGRPGALRAAAGQVRQDGVGDEVDGDLRDFEVVPGGCRFFGCCCCCRTNGKKEKEATSLSLLSLPGGRNRKNTKKEKEGGRKRNLHLVGDLEHVFDVLPERADADGAGRDVVLLEELVVEAHGRTDRGLAEHAHDIRVRAAPVRGAEADVVDELLRGGKEGAQKETVSDFFCPPFFFGREKERRE